MVAFWAGESFRDSLLDAILYARSSDSIEEGGSTVTSEARVKAVHPNAVMEWEGPWCNVYTDDSKKRRIVRVYGASRSSWGWASAWRVIQSNRQEWCIAKAEAQQ